MLAHKQAACGASVSHARYAPSRASLSSARIAGSKSSSVVATAALRPSIFSPNVAPKRLSDATCNSRRGAASIRAAAAAAGADGEVLDTVVIGAGISGLVTAQALATQHAGAVNSFLVTEARERVGGNITSMEGGGYVWEEGPNSFQPNDSMLLAAVSVGVVVGVALVLRFLRCGTRGRLLRSRIDLIHLLLTSN
jgi:oxygen-dependent protoporphyrinogen oxidase